MKTSRINRYLICVLLSTVIFCGGRGVSLAQQKENMENPFGVLEFLNWDHDWNNYKYPGVREIKRSVDLMKDAGVSIVRMDFLWEDIEPKQGEFNFTNYDLIVGTVNGSGQEILGVLNYSASWASAGWNVPPQDYCQFVNYAVSVIRRYKGKVKYWEIWNEPDSSTYWKTQDGLKSYCALLKQVYLAAKEADPSCKILNGGLANGISSVNKLYDNGARDYFDILNVHFFENPNYPGMIKGVASFPKIARKIMVRNGDAAKKIWVTEIGCPGVPNSVQTGQWWMGKNPGVRRQGQWVKEVYTELLKDKNVEKVFWAFFRDCRDHWGTGVDYFGLVSWDFSPKPGFYAYKDLTKQWRDAHPGDSNKEARE